MSNSLQPSPTLLISNLPPKTLVGIDLLSFTSTPNFHGIKDIPPGAHFVYTGTTESFSLRSGEWFIVAGGRKPENTLDIRLREWNTDHETLALVDESQDEGKQRAMQQRANLSRIWASGGLLAYQTRLEEKKDGGSRSKEDVISPGRGDWESLTNHISPYVLNRILDNAEVDSESRARWMVTSGSSAKRDADQIPGLSEADISSAGGVAGEEETELRFLPIDLKKTWREGAVGRERTEAAQDRSWALGSLLDSISASTNTALAVADNSCDSSPESQILGELQFTFLSVLTLMNFSCLEQWKRLLGLIFTCRAAIKEKEQFYVDVLRLLRLQLSHCDDVEGGLFEMNGDDGGSLLRKLLTGFRRAIYEVFNGAESEVKVEFGKLADWVQKEYGWELSRESIVRRGMVELEDGEQVELEINGAEEEDESGEYAPVIVDLGDNEGVHEDVDMTDRPR